MLNPWLSCGRGASPVCPRVRGRRPEPVLELHDGPLAPGIHIGTSKDVPGGFANLMPAHHSMLFKVPDSIPDELAVFADPFAVSLHGITRHPPPPGARRSCTAPARSEAPRFGILSALYPDVEVGVVARFDAQPDLARKLGGAVFRHEPAGQLIEETPTGRAACWRRPRTPDGVPGRSTSSTTRYSKKETLEVSVRLRAWWVNQ